MDVLGAVATIGIPMDIVTVVANLGFPVGLSIYLLTRFEKQMKGLDDSITGKDGIIDKLDEVRDAVKKNHRKS